jgi:hypothetical protein
MADTILEQITQDIIDTINTVTVLAGYENDLVCERAVRPYNTVRDRLVVVSLGDPELGASNSDKAVAWRQTYNLACYASEPEESDVPLDRRLGTMQADIEKALRVDHNRGALAVDTALLGSVRTDDPSSSSDEQMAELAVLVSVHYRTLEADPYTQ